MTRCERGQQERDPSEGQGTKWTSMVNCVQSHAVSEVTRRKKFKSRVQRKEKKTV